MNLSPLLILIFFAVPVFAQTGGNFSVEKSAPYENKRELTFVRDMYRDSAGYIYIVKSEDKVTMGEVLFGSIADKDPTTLIEKYDEKLQLIYSLPMTIGDIKGHTAYYHGVYVLNQRPYFFSSYFDKQEDMRYLFRHELGEKGKLGKAVKVAEMESRKGGGRFNILFSPDSTLLAVVTRPAVKSKKAEELSFTVYDGAFKVVRTGSTTFPYINRDMDAKGFTLTNQGDFSVLISYEHDKNKDGKSFSEELFIFPAGEDTPRRIMLDLGAYFLLDFQVNADKAGNLYGVGPYNLIEKREKFKNGIPPTSLGTAWIKIERGVWKLDKPVLNPYTTDVKSSWNQNPKWFTATGFSISTFLNHGSPKMAGSISTWNRTGRQRLPGTWYTASTTTQR